MKDQKNIYLRKTKQEKSRRIIYEFSYKMGILNEKRCKNNKDAKAVSEGVHTYINVIGKYINENVCGLLVLVPDDTTIRHITLSTRNGMTPDWSNKVLSDPDTTIQEYFTQPLLLDGWYGNYYA